MGSCCFETLPWSRVDAEGGTTETLRARNRRIRGEGRRARLEEMKANDAILTAGVAYLCLFGVFKAELELGRT